MMSTAPLPSFDTFEGIEGAFSKKWFKQADIDRKRTAMAQLLKEKHQEQTGVELAE